MVYDVTGNLVKRITVSENIKITDRMSASGASGSFTRREVGYWDLTDRRGRPVSTGAYLVRGTVTAKNGKREKVSIILGVR